MYIQCKQEPAHSNNNQPKPIVNMIYLWFQFERNGASASNCRRSRNCVFFFIDFLSIDCCIVVDFSFISFFLLFFCSPFHSEKFDLIFYRFSVQFRNDSDFVVSKYGIDIDIIIMQSNRNRIAIENNNSVWFLYWQWQRDDWVRLCVSLLYRTLFIRILSMIWLIGLVLLIVDIAN